MGYDQILYGIVVTQLVINRDLYNVIKEHLKLDCDLVSLKCKIGSFEPFNHRLAKYFEEDNKILSRAELEKLLKICEEIEKDYSKLDELLPSADDEESDEQCFNDLVKVLREALKEEKYDSFEYASF